MKNIIILSIGKHEPLSRDWDQLGFGGTSQTGVGDVRRERLALIGCSNASGLWLAETLFPKSFAFSGFHFELR